MTIESFLKHNLTSADHTYNTIFIDEATMIDEIDAIQIARYGKSLQLFGDPQ